MTSYLDYGQGKVLMFLGSQFLLEDIQGLVNGAHVLLCTICRNVTVSCAGLTIERLFMSPGEK